MSKKSDTDANVDAQAAKWSTELSSEYADRQTLNEFADWHKGDRTRKEAFGQVDRIWQGVSQLQHLEAYAQLPKQQAKPSFGSLLKAFWVDLSSPMYGYAAAACVAVAVLGFFLFPNGEPEVSLISASYTTAHGEVKTVTLVDGTHVTLAPSTQLQVTYSDTLRSVELSRGEGMFEVAKNPEKPFVVHAGKTETRVLGTVFTVGRRSTKVTVAVKEGRVQVDGRAAAGSSVTERRVLTPGKAVVATLSGKVGEVITIDPSEVGSWKEGRLVFSDTSLKEIVEDVNQYSVQKVLIEGADTAKLRVSIAFDVADIDAMLSDLAEVLDLTIDRSREGYIVLKQNSP